MSKVTHSKISHQTANLLVCVSIPEVHILRMKHFEQLTQISAQIMCAVVAGDESRLLLKIEELKELSKVFCLESKRQVADVGQSPAICTEEEEEEEEDLLNPRPFIFGGKSSSSSSSLPSVQNEFPSKASTKKKKRRKKNQEEEEDLRNPRPFIFGGSSSSSSSSPTIQNESGSDASTKKKRRKRKKKSNPPKSTSPKKSISPMFWRKTNEHVKERKKKKVPGATKGQKRRSDHQRSTKSVPKRIRVVPGCITMNSDNEDDKVVSRSQSNSDPGTRSGSESPPPPF